MQTDNPVWPILAETEFC